MANKRARQNEQLFNQAVALGHSPQNFGGSGGGGAYTNYLRGLIAQGRVNRNPPPQAPATPPPIKQAQAPRRLNEDGDGGNLKIKKKSKRKNQALSKGTGQLRINKPAQGVTAAAGSSSGGINV